MNMRVAILHAAGDEAVAEQTRNEMGVGEVIVAPLAAQLRFGEQLVLLVPWTERAAAQTCDVERVCGSNDAVVLWRRDDAPVPTSLKAVSTIGAAATARAISPALRLAWLERERPQATVEPRRGSRAAFALVLVAAGALALLGFAGAIAYVGEADIRQFMLAAKSVIFAP